MTSDFNENTVESAALVWIEGLGYTARAGPDIAPETPFAERIDYGHVFFG
jgi:type I restriction enzyme R subunit